MTIASIALLCLGEINCGKGYCSLLVVGNTPHSYTPGHQSTQGMEEPPGRGGSALISGTKLTAFFSRAEPGSHDSCTSR